MRLALTARIVSAFVSGNRVPASDVPALIHAVGAALADLEFQRSEPLPKPAAPIKKSVHDNYIVCLEDGVRLRMLKRYIRTQYGMSPEEYRAKWGLPFDYPMVAPAYARLRSAHAKRIGLGTTAIATRKPNKV
jgi:predicted transcriptional regulator